MFQRRTSGSVVCPSCGSLVGVRDDKCYTCGRSNPGLWGFGPMLRSLGVDFPFAQIVVGVCVTLWVITLLMSGGQVGGGGMLSILSPSSNVLLLFGASGAFPVFSLGRWWTVLSAGWLHAGLLHIGMNMYWLWQMGPAITDLFGPARTVIIYVVGGVAGFALSSFAGAFFPDLPFLRAAALTLGASAPVFGLIGAMYHYGRTMSSSVKQVATSIMIQAVIFGFLVPGIDNYAHLGGFAGGYMMSSFLNPMTRERGDHMLIAVVLLALSALSVVASVLSGLSLFR
ncbi:MAG TPA: rhomboid family intramembrane serine protease [Vicinamibacterales bacterium]|nr:rhomboid family intramembrane serine protease [Vicinamibacterales bacterium]